MGGRIAACLVDVSDHTSEVNRGDFLFNDLWSGGCHSFGNWLPNTKDQLIQSEQQQ